MCLALRDDHGQLARVATNYDGLVVSALVEAQSPARVGRRRAGPCPLRGMRTAGVAVGAGARLAAAGSLVLASAKLRDHVVDGDGPRALARMSAGLADRWARQGVRTGQDLGFDAGVLLDAVGRQAAVESALGLGSPVLAATEPTETATAAVFAHTAVLAGRPENAAPLGEAGRLFGRIAHLLDAVEDLAEDTARGAWNPLTATGTDLAEARRLCDDALLGVRIALREAAFEDDALVHALLVHELDAAVIRAFGHATWPDRNARHDKDDEHDECVLWRWPRVEFDPSGARNLVLGCCAFSWMCCTCQFCCRDPFPGPWSRKSRDNPLCDNCSCETCCVSGCCACECCSA
jgi:hypothetical protein